MNIKRLLIIAVPVVLLAILYLAGPTPQHPAYRDGLPVVPSDAGALEQYVADEEARHQLKPDNEAVVLWNDSSRSRTEYAAVYLHGFSASRMEGDPVHRDFARKFGMNLYLARLADHGIDTTEALLNFTPDRLWESAKEALAIGKQLGDKVILIGTSTGASLSLLLAARYPDDVAAMINLSPNIEINNGAAFITNNPWGLQISRMVKGGDYNDTGGSEEESKYWYNRYRLEAVAQLQELLETSMTESLFREVKQPSLTLYYYQDEARQDPTVRVDAILRMHEMLGTPDDKKVAKAIPSAGVHVIGSSLVSKDVAGVEAAIDQFAIEKLGLRPRETAREE